MNDITFLVFTFNEESRIEYMLRCLEGQGEIVIIDNFSTDKTLEIAKKYTDNIFHHQNPGYIENEVTMNFALSKVNTKWVYLAFVDELIPLSLMKELKEIVAEDKYKAVEVYRINFMYGQKVYNYGKHHLRMFVPECVDFKGNVVHKLGRYLIPRGQVYKIKASNDSSTIWHFSSYDMSKLELAHNRYADLEAKQRHNMVGQKFSGIRALWKLIFYFWGTYIGLGGFRGGWPGFFISVQISYFKFSIEARLWEYDHNRSIEVIENRYDKIKEDLLNN